MGRPVHFEIQADDLERAKAFYEAVFGWRFEDYTNVMGSPYFGVITGEDGGQPGINGGLLPRPAPAPAAQLGANAAVLTMQVDDYDETAAKVLANGGVVALEKFPIPGMAWQGYFLDSERNTFGVHEADESAGR